MLGSSGNTLFAMNEMCAGGGVPVRGATLIVSAAKLK